MESAVAQVPWQRFRENEDGEEAVPDFNIPTDAEQEPAIVEDPETTGRPDDDEEWDQELTIEINPPPDSLRRSARERHAPSVSSSWIAPGTRSAVRTSRKPSAYKRRLKSVIEAL